MHRARHCNHSAGLDSSDFECRCRDWRVVRDVVSTGARAEGRPDKLYVSRTVTENRRRVLVATDRPWRATHPPSVARLTRGVPWLCVARSRGGCHFVVRALSRRGRVLSLIALLGDRTFAYTSRSSLALHAPPCREFVSVVESVFTLENVVGIVTRNLRSRCRSSQVWKTCLPTDVRTHLTSLAARAAVLRLSDRRIFSKRGGSEKEAQCAIR